MVRRQLVGSRNEAQSAIAAGLVLVDGAPVHKAASQVHAGQAITVTAPPRRFVSRGGDKLEHGLGVFGVDPAGRRCLDAGVSTGGFTDCLLQHGAAHVVGIDVGYGQVHERIRTDPRVAIRERTNIRELSPHELPDPAPDLLVCDVSFIALRLVLAHLRRLGAADAEVIALVKPQFEATREEVGKGGVVRDPQVWRRVLGEVAESASALGWQGFDVTPSPLLGPAGNVEFLAHLVGEPPSDGPLTEARIDRAVTAGERLRVGGAVEEGT